MVDQDKAKQMAAIVREIEDVGRAKKEANKQFSEQLSALWLALENLAGDVESGQRSIDLGPGTELRDADGNLITTEGELRDAVFGDRGKKRRGGRS